MSSPVSPGYITCAQWIGLEGRETSSVYWTSWIQERVTWQGALSISNLARALILDFNFVSKTRVIQSIINSILCSPIPAISRGHICASRQSISLDAVGVERDIKFMDCHPFYCMPRDVHARNRWQKLRCCCQSSPFHWSSACASAIVEQPRV